MFHNASTYSTQLKQYKNQRKCIWLNSLMWPEHCVQFRGLDAKKQQLEIIHAYISKRDVLVCFQLALVSSVTSVWFEYLMNFVVCGRPSIIRHTSAVHCANLACFVTSLMSSCQTNYIPAAQLLYRQLTEPTRFSGGWIRQTNGFVGLTWKCL